MKKILFLFILIIFSVCPVNAKSITFALVSDVHLNPSNSKTTFTESEKNLIFTMESINKNPDVNFTVFLGDHIDKSRLDSLYSFMNIVQKLNKPYYMVYGNHDAYEVGGVPKEDFSKIMHEYNKRQPKEDTSFYFKAGKSAYGLVLDGSSYVVPNAHGRYLPELLDEVEKLLKFKKKDMIFIFQHFPLIPPTDNLSHYTLDDEYYWEKINKYDNIVLIASGHFHHEKITVDKKGITHISASALGSRSNSNGSGVYQIVTVEYDKKMFKKPTNIKVNVKDIQF